MLYFHLQNIPVTLYNESTSEVYLHGWPDQTDLMPQVDKNGLSLYSLILIPIYLFSVALPGYRWTGLISFTGMISLFLVMIRSFYPQEELQLSKVDASKDGFVKIRLIEMYGAPQIVVMVSSR